MPSKPPARMGLRQLIIPLLVLICFYVLIPQLSSFRHSLTLLRHMEPAGVLAALACTVTTYLAAAATYYFIALHPLRYRRTLLVQVASMFVNRLLPAGIGALGSNFAYLRRQKHNAVQAGAVITLNNGLGMSGHVLVVAVSLLLFRSHLPPLHFNHQDITKIWIVVGVLVVGLLTVLTLPTWRHKVIKALTSFASQLIKFGEQPVAILKGQISSVVLTLSNVLSLYFCVSAVHASASFITVLLVFTLGIGIGTATPTPGGLGGFEAGLVAGFIAYGMDSSQALAAALLYRLLSYWLAVVAGAIAFAYAQQHHVFAVRR